MTKKSKTVVQNRSAKTGRFITEKYAKSHPSTTVTEKNKKPSGSKKKPNVPAMDKIIVDKVINKRLNDR